MTEGTERGMERVREKEKKRFYSIGRGINTGEASRPKENH